MLYDFTTIKSLDCETICIKIKMITTISFGTFLLHVYTIFPYHTILYIFKYTTDVSNLKTILSWHKRCQF